MAATSSSCNAKCVCRDGLSTQRTHINSRPIHVCVSLLDLSAALDTIDHNIFITRLLHLGLDAPNSSLPVCLSVFTCHLALANFYRRGSIACCASADIAIAEMSVRPSVRHIPVLYQNEVSWRRVFLATGKREPKHSSF